MFRARTILACVLTLALAAASACTSPSTAPTPTPEQPSASGTPGTGEVAAPKVRVDYRPKVRVERYRVQGATPAELFGEMQRLGPGPWIGEAAWQTSYDTLGDYDESGRCQLERIIVRVDVTLTLPEWKAPSAASAATRAYWRRTVSTLERHEIGHQRLVESFGRRLVRDLKDIDSAISCAKLYDRHDRTADRVFRDLNRANRRYDARTRHGLNQSAA